MKVPVPQSAQEPSNIPVDTNVLPTEDNGVEQAPAPQKDDTSDNPFEKEKFDAGIDVDEDADPKSYIERLSGKLAQKLRDYNKTEKDSTLNKFALNLVSSAAVPGMTPEDAKDSIKKVEDNIGKEQAPTETQPEQTQEVQPETPVENNNQVGSEPKMESKKQTKKLVEETIDELVERLLNGTDEEPTFVKQKSNKKSPFSKPEFN